MNNHLTDTQIPDARTIREETKVSLRKLATKLGISAMYLSDLERGNRTWNDEMKQRWSRVIGREFPGR